MFHCAFYPPAHALLETPLQTSQIIKFLSFYISSDLPSNTTPNPPLTTYPHPTPPPLCKATQVAPLTASPTKFCTLISAQNLLPSYTDEVYRNGLSAELVS
jgi:hypothetical protein